MALLALYENWRPWENADTCVASVIVALLLLFVFFNHGKSFLANAMLIGGLVGCAWALLSSTDLYRKKISYIELGIGLGVLFGVLGKWMAHAIREEKPHQEESRASLPTASPNKVDHGFVFWNSELAISAISFGVTLAAFFKMSYQSWIGCTAGLLLVSGVVGSRIGLAGKRSPWMEACLELWVCIALATGVGTIIGWKFALPVLLFDVNPPIST